MSWRISILDKSPIAEHETAADALARTLALAQQAENLGYHRFWIAEHHNTPQLASPSPELLIAWILGQTSRIRVGSGGVMLQHYSPYKVAENFNVLAALAPGRVDLGVGKAPGGLPLSTRALQQGLNQQEKGSFAEQLAQLDRWIRPEHQSTEEAVLATPLPPSPAQGFLLGASRESALLAASLDWHFVFAAHLNGDPDLLREVIATWRENSVRDVIVAVQGLSHRRRPKQTRWHRRWKCGAWSWPTASASRWPAKSRLTHSRVRQGVSRCALRVGRNLCWRARRNPCLNTLTPSMKRGALTNLLLIPR